MQKIAFPIHLMFVARASGTLDAAKVILMDLAKEIQVPKWKEGWVEEADVWKSAVGTDRKNANELMEGAKWEKTASRELAEALAAPHSQAYRSEFPDDEERKKIGQETPEELRRKEVEALIKRIDKAEQRFLEEEAKVKAGETEKIPEAESEAEAEADEEAHIEAQEGQAPGEQNRKMTEAGSNKETKGQGMRLGDGGAGGSGGGGAAAAAAPPAPPPATTTAAHQIAQLRLLQIQGTGDALLQTSATKQCSS
eukprot:gnl/MRDRNA2_/MRDRNA2_108845_c0_seq1.p1 gnl/MRDRNA2_/MRDRNA2_108845_c0~~gnl/MRDRNA2_/MRDRNA2_108845_c0_seq1.p1  ORF type:complete len:253 (-),score=92.23 gnl/MRDRNA2_/MRDRNA2_108845_c0_seq1:323-1081(-)